MLASLASPSPPATDRTPLRGYRKPTNQLLTAICYLLTTHYPLSPYLACRKLRIPANPNPNRYISWNGSAAISTSQIETPIAMAK